MWQNKLKEVTVLKQSFGENLRDGASKETISAFNKTIEHQYGIALPEEYMEFLTKVNGFDFNGYCIFGFSSQKNDYLDLIEQNEFFHSNKELRKYIFLGTSDLNWYVFDLEKKSFYETDASETIWETFSNFSDLLEKILGDSLG